MSDILYSETNLRDEKGEGMLKRIFAILCVTGLLWISVSIATSSVADPAPSVTDMGGQLRGTTPESKPNAGSDAYSNPSGQQQAAQGTADVTIASDAAVSSEGYAAQNIDENAVRIAGNVTVLMSNISVEKTGDTGNVDNSSFYGQNAGLLVTDGASATIAGAQVHTDGSGANGVFCHGKGTNINISDSTITTNQDHSGGILATGGGTLSASNLTIETQGNVSAAIRADRDGGVMTVDGGTYTANGMDSPAIYATAAISVSNATLVATQSEVIVVEGSSSVTLVASDATGNMQATGSENTHNVMLRQSNGSDASEGRGMLSITGGSLTAKAGDMFYATNTDCDISLTDVALTLANQNLLTVAGNDGSQGWGRQGSNGGDCNMTANNQTLQGNIAVDSLSRLTLTLQNDSVFIGTINPDGQAGTVIVMLDDTSTWMLTADAYVTSFIGSVGRVVTNGYTLHVAQ